MGNIHNLSIIVMAAVFFFIPSVVGICEFEELKENCKCASDPITHSFRVECSCTKGQKLNLTYDGLENIHLNTMHLLVKDCEGEVIISDDILENFLTIKSVVFSKISKLRVLKDGLILHETGKLEFKDVGRIELQPGSVSLLGDSISNITIFNSEVVVLDQESTGRNISKQMHNLESVFECHCNQLYPHLDPFNAETLLGKAVYCSITDEVVKKDGCLPKSEPNSATPSVGVIYHTGIMALALMCLSFL